jgi:hypothetical protein
LSTPEPTARIQIDAQLSAAGWTVQGIADLNLSARLARSLSDSDKAELQATGGISLKQLASDLLKATDPDNIQKVADASRFGSSLPDFNFFNPEAETEKNQGAYLPHWSQNGVIYFITFRLADSLPQEKLKTFTEEKQIWMHHNPEGIRGEFLIL